jgi:leader peptidase (prepilin peptidase)/N-methyltransferase
MTLGSWALAALCAGALGWVGPYVIGLLPPSPDAEAETPSYQVLARVPRLSVWLAVGGIVLVTIVACGVPAKLLPAWTLVCSVGIWLAYIDARTSLLPTRIVWPLFSATLVVVAVEAWFAEDISLFVRAVVASFAAFGVFWLFWWVGELWKAGGFGFGDVRFAAPLGLVLGTAGGWAAPVGLYLGILIGGVVGVLLKARGHHGAFALGPWMLLGAALGPVVSSAF